MSHVIDTGVYCTAKYGRLWQGDEFCHYLTLIDSNYITEYNFFIRC